MNSLKGNFIYNVVYQMLLIVLPLVTAPYIARTLGVNGVGIYSYTYSVAQNFLLFAMLGISNHGTRAIASVRDDYYRTSKTFWSIYTIQFTMYILTSILYAFYVLYFDIDNKLIAIIQYIYVLSGILDISWFFFGMEKFKITVSRNIIIKLLTVLLIFIFVKDKYDLAIYTFIMAFGSMFSQIYLWRYLLKSICFVKISYKDVKVHFSKVLILFIPVIAYSIYKLMDKIMLGNMTTYSEVGYYENASKIINIPLGVITALGTVMLPRMSNLTAKGDTAKFNSYLKISIKLVTYLSASIAFGLIGISDNLVPIYFGNEYLPCINLIKLLSISVFFVSWANVIRTQYLIPRREDGTYIQSMIFGAIVNFVLNFFLIPKYNGIGAAIGTIFAEFTVMLVQMIKIKKEIPVFKYCISTIPFCIIGLVMEIVVSKIGMLFVPSVIVLIIQILVGCIIFCGLSLLYFLFFKDELGEIIIHEVTTFVSKFKIGIKRKKTTIDKR